MNVTNNIVKAPSGFLAEDDAIPVLAAWQQLGRRCALVTIVAIEGGAPRSVGAQMVVAEDGRSHGYLSGGCLEQAIVLEAQTLIAARRNKLIRYGKGSPYFDVKLPCGSGLDIYFDTLLMSETIVELQVHAGQRRPVALETNLANGTHSILPLAGNAPPASARAGDVFIRTYLPLPRLVLIGSGPAVGALARLSAIAGMEATIWAGDEPTRRALDEAAVEHLATPAPPDSLTSAVDSFTAIVLAFPEHDLEPVILAKVLKTNCFYIGVLGNHAVHRRRLDQLREMGLSDAELGRIRAPIGTIAQAKGKATLGFGVFAEILGEAKTRGLVS